MANQTATQTQRPPNRPPNHNAPVAPPPPAMSSFEALFIPAAKTKVTIKALFWGAPGTHKTRSALTFPRPAVISVEGLAEIYSRDFPGAFFTRATTIAAVENALSVIIADGGRSCDTIVIDSITALYDERKAYYLAKRGYLGQVERERINIDMKRVYNLIAAAPVNVVIIAREADLYEEMETGGNNYMKPDSEKSRPKRVGVRIDADKSASYVPNFVLHMTGGGGAILEKVQGMAIKESQIPVATWDGFFSAIASTLADGDNPDDIRAGVGKDLFIQYWKSRGLTTGQMANALGIKSTGEWTKGRAAADLIIEPYAISKGWIKADQPEPDEDAGGDEPTLTDNSAFMQSLVSALVPKPYSTPGRLQSTYEQLVASNDIPPDWGTEDIIRFMREYAIENGDS